MTQTTDNCAGGAEPAGFLPESWPGLAALWAETKGDPSIRVAILDGVPALQHAALRGADLTRLPTLVNGAPDPESPMCGHGTHVTSVIFGRAEGGVSGISPNCRGLIIPIFPNHHRGPVPQLDVARGIELALDAGAHVINISGGQPVSPGGTDPMLTRAVRRCEQQGALLIAAAGNDAGQILHAPAAVPTTLAVGALGLDGRPLAMSNWGAGYRRNGLLAPGELVRGALPGGGSALMTGTSVAAPIVTGVVALLLSWQRQHGLPLRPALVREALLRSALRCDPNASADCRRFLVGVLNIPGARVLITKGAKKTMSDATLLTSTDLAGDAGPVAASAPGIAPSAALAAAPLGEGVSPASGSNTTPGCACRESRAGRVFSIGTIGYDFGTEARRDTFRQLMEFEGAKPPNPYDPKRMVEYLQRNPAECTKLIWTVNLELTPIYAIEAEVPYSERVYGLLVDFLKGQAQPEDNKSGHVARVSIPGILTGRTVRLFSGQVVPLVIVQSRGLWAWNVDALFEALRGSADEMLAKRGLASDERTDQMKMLERALKNILSRIYYEFRNLGQSPSDRALNFAVTNAFQLGQVLAEAMMSDRGGKTRIYALRDYTVERSPYCRMDSDCWDIKLRFFDPENVLQATTVLRFTVDVSDTLPVTMGPIRKWEEAGSAFGGQ